MSNKNRDKSQNIEAFGYILSRMIQACQRNRHLDDTRTSESFKKVPITENFMREELVNLNCGTIFEDTSKSLPITF